jgi:hypothetical protein
VYLGHVPESLTGKTYTFGPRFSYHKLDRLVPFAQALFGGSHFSESTGGITGGGTQFTFAIGGGGDIGLGSSRKFALRLEGDYFGICSSGSTTDSASSSELSTASGRNSLPFDRCFHDLPAAVRRG